MEKSMNDPLLTLMEKTLKDLRSATSSLESAVGVMHLNLQDGQQIDLFGQDHHPVSHSQSQEREKPKMMSDTSGHTSSISSESVRLQQYLASKLPQQLEQTGSTIYKLTWKTKVTPRQWQYCQLAASVPRTKENDSSSWPTPVASDNRDRGSFDDPSIQRRIKIGKSVELSMMVHSVQPWPTPSTRDHKGGRKLDENFQSTSHDKGVKYGMTLDQIPQLVPWPTPSTQDNPQVRGEGAAANAPTRGTTLGGAARLVNAETGKPVKSQLNPRFSLWLMGLPIEWA